MGSSNRRILVADDNKVNRFILQKFFKKWEFTADFVEDGKAAVKATQEQQYDLVIMDYHMPEMNGLEATKAILAAQGEDIVVIGLSATISEEERAAAAEAGMKDFIVKPFDPEKLRQKLEKLLDIA